MSVEFDEKRQTWSCRYRVKNPLTGEITNKRKRGFRLKREALKYEQLHDMEELNGAGAVTFIEMAEKWEDSMQCSNQTKLKHREHYEKRFYNFLEVPIGDITKQQLAEWRSDLANNEQFSTATKNQTISFVKGVFRYASDVYDLPDLTGTLKAFKKSDDEILKEMEVWTPQQYELFRSAIPEELTLYKYFFDLLFWTGMRRGEAIALHKSDLNNGWINIRFSYRTSTEGLKPTKTKERRKIQLDDITWAELQTLNADPGKFVFGGNEPLSPTTIKRVWDNAIKKSGVPPIRIHDLRHSHATWLINNGINIVAVSKRLGHASIEQTLKTYTHLLYETDSRMLDFINIQRKCTQNVPTKK